MTGSLMPKKDFPLNRKDSWSKCFPSELIVVDGATLQAGHCLTGDTNSSLVVGTETLWPPTEGNDGLFSSGEESSTKTKGGRIEKKRHQERTASHSSLGASTIVHGTKIKNQKKGVAMCGVCPTKVT